jgi:hypothetical protein
LFQTGCSSARRACTACCVAEAAEGELKRIDIRAPQAGEIPIRLDDTQARASLAIVTKRLGELGRSGVTSFPLTHRSVPALPRAFS